MDSTTNTPTSKTCSLCGLTRDLIKFAKYKGSKDGYTDYCEDCYYNIQKDRADMKKRSGLNEEDFMNLVKLIAQNHTEVDSDEEKEVRYDEIFGYYYYDPEYPDDR